jgi:chromosome segregation protein
LQQESTRNTSDAQSKEVELGEFNKALAELEQRLQTQQQELSLAQKLEADLQEKLKVGEEKIQEQKQESQDLNRKLDAKQNEYNLTKSMVDNLEGFPESIRFLKKNTNWTKQAPLFSDILFCKEAYRIAIENYLEPVMNHYVVQTQQEAIQAITLLSDSAQGRANFFILDALKSSVKKTEKTLTKSNLVPALDIIDVDAKYRPLCELLLKNVYVIESGEEEELAKTLPQEGQILLSSSGKYSKSTYTMAGGSVGLFEGKRIGRAKNLENLAKEISSLEQNLTTLQNAIEKESQSLETLRSASQKDQNSQKERAVQSLNNEYISIKTKQEQYVAFMENSKNRKQDIESKIAGILAEIERSEPKVIELKTEQEIKQQALLQAQLEYQNLSDRLTADATAYNQENIKFHQQQNKVSGLEKDLDYRNSQHANLSERIQSNHTIFEQTQASIKETLKHVDHSDDDLLAMYSQKEALEKGVEELEQAYYAARGAITETENTIAEQRRKKEQADFLANELKDQKTNLKLELNGLKERLSVEFSIDINDLLENDVPKGENEEALKEKTEKLKRQLEDFGGINPMAMEAYQEMQERFVFIQTQKKDLIDAKDSLLATIKEIDDTAKAKFMEAFTQVREHFIEVFRSLFNEEDSCDLVLSDPENPLDSDIDILARPKGKRPLSINQLSGGEKTLTATALLFSLYLLKPAPFCIFDEVDAPLDDTNIDKFNTIIRKFSNQSQFIVVSHNKRTIASTDIIYGVTMAEQGVSKVVAVDLREVA